MTGAMLATIAGHATSGGGVTPGAVAWDDIVGGGLSFNNVVTFGGLSSTISLQITGTSGVFYYNKNAAGLTKIAEAGTVTISNGDTLQWGSARGVGTATVTNLSDGSTVLDTFNYDVEKSFGTF